MQNRKARRLVLHAGLPKTATTSIQNAIFTVRNRLQDEAGILYPGTDPNHTSALCTAFLTDPRDHISNKIAGFTDLEALRQTAAHIRADLSLEIETASPDTILFSAEGMSNLSCAELTDFRNWALRFAEQIEVLYIVRQPLHYTTSVIQQHLKGGDILEDMYANPPLANFRGRISNAIAAFGREAVAVRKFEDMIVHPDGVVGFFLDCVGVTQAGLRKAAVEAQCFENESLSHEAALILSSLNRQRPAFVDGQRAPMRTFNELGIIEQIRGVKFYLPEDVREKVTELSKPDTIWLADTFDIGSYLEPFRGAVPVPGATLSKATIDSVALLLSNLINDRHASTLTQRARSKLKEADADEMCALASEIRRVAPARPLPDFLRAFIKG